MNTQELIAEAVALPIDERAIMIDCLLKSLNSPEAEIDKKWAAIAKQRLTELGSGKVKAISGDEVFEKSGNGLRRMNLHRNPDYWKYRYN